MLADEVSAHVPFLTRNAVAADRLAFQNKEVQTIPTTGITDFRGVYAPQSAEGLYGIDSEGYLHVGGAEATINAFHAYLHQTSTAAKTVSFETTTGIRTVKTEADAPMFRLDGTQVRQNTKTKGIYIRNGRKIIVK